MATNVEHLTPERRITLALGNMPYLPLVARYSKSPEPESLATTLEGLAEVLAEVARSNEQREREYEQLRRDVQGMRRLFGVER